MDDYLQMSTSDQVSTYIVFRTVIDSSWNREDEILCPVLLVLHSHYQPKCNSRLACMPRFRF